jgi:glycine reductase complex component B subunit gamma
MTRLELPTGRAMPEPLRVVHYVNQFFGGVGGEDKASLPPSRKDGAVGPGLALQKALGDRGQVVATLICGDNYANEQINDFLLWAAEQLRDLEPDVLIAGPAFNAGRYGEACGALCAWAGENLHIPTVTGMYRENPGTDQVARMTYVVQTEASAVGMAHAAQRMADLAVKLARGETVGSAREEGYAPRGIRRNVFRERTGAERGLAMLLAKLRGEPFQTEMPVQVYQSVTPAPPLPDLSRATVAIVTEAGVVPMGNPDRIEFIRATKWRKYALNGSDDLREGEFEAVHGGFDNSWTNQDPDRMLGVDVLRQLEREGVIGKLYDHYYVTTGNGTPIEASARFGREIAADLHANGVQAVISPAT